MLLFSFLYTFYMNQPVNVMERKFSRVCELAMALQLRRWYGHVYHYRLLLPSTLYDELSHFHKTYFYSCLCICIGVCACFLHACLCFDIYKGNVAAQHLWWWCDCKNVPREIFKVMNNISSSFSSPFSFACCAAGAGALLKNKHY